MLLPQRLGKSTKKVLGTNYKLEEKRKRIKIREKKKPEKFIKKGQRKNYSESTEEEWQESGDNLNDADLNNQI